MHSFPPPPLQPFNEEEEALFDAAAQHAYESFRDKAAESRGMTKEAMQVGGHRWALGNWCYPCSFGRCALGRRMECQDVC